jgi:hypothetical protein
LDGRHFFDGSRLTDKDVINLAAGGGWDIPTTSPTPGGRQ